MTVNQLAREFKVRPAVIYNIIYSLEITQDIAFSRQGRNYALTTNEVEIITRELRKRGYKKKLKARGQLSHPQRS